MHAFRVLRPVALIVTVALVAVALASPGARALGAAPKWTAGDYWEYAHDDGSSSRIEVRARESTGGFDTLRFTETETSGSVSVTTEHWLRESDLGEARTSITIFGALTVTTYDPPQAFAAFPLSTGKAWYGNSSFRITVNNNQISSGTLPFSGAVEGETDVTVPAGRFHVYVIRSPAQPGIFGHTKFYYSDTVGYWVKVETYNVNGDRTSERSMSRYNYQSQFWWNVLLAVLVGVIVVAVIAFLVRRRRQSMGRPGGPQGPPQMPVSPPPGSR